MTIDLNAWAGYAFRHLSTILVVIGLFVAVGKPHAQSFIEETVDSRLDALEDKLIKLEEGHSSLVAGQNAIAGDVSTIQTYQELENRQSAEQSKAVDEILRILQTQ